MKKEFLYLHNSELTQICVGLFSIILNFAETSISISLENDIFIDGKIVWKHGDKMKYDSSLFSLLGNKIEQCFIENNNFYLYLSSTQLCCSIKLNGYETGSINCEGLGIFIIGK